MDTLARTQKLEALGFERPKAEGLVQMVKQSIDEEVAKKVDLRELRADLKSDISEVRLEIAQVKSELKQDISDLRTELKQDISEVRLEIGQVKSELKQDISDLRTELKQDIAEVRVEIGQVKSALKLEINDLRGELKEFKGEIKGEIKNSRLSTIIWLGSIMFSLMSLSLASMVYLEKIRKFLGVIS